MRAPRKQTSDGYRTSDSRKGRLEKEKVRHSDREVNRSESQDDDGRWLEVKQAETTVGSEFHRVNRRNKNGQEGGEGDWGVKRGRKRPRGELRRDKDMGRRQEELLFPQAASKRERETNQVSSAVLTLFCSAAANTK